MMGYHGFNSIPVTVIATRQKWRSEEWMEGKRDRHKEGTRRRNAEVRGDRGEGSKSG
jgi:hypothetical protein